MGLDKGLEPRIPRPLETKPSDAEARAHGFIDAEDWWCRLASGALLHPRVVEANFRSLPEGTHPEGEPGGARESGDVQWWQHLQGVNPDPAQVPVLEDLERLEAGSRALPDAVESAGAPRVPGVDSTAVVAEELGVSHAYLLTDVEAYNQEFVF